jgi:anti-anti-sigma regulatory factor
MKCKTIQLPEFLSKDILENIYKENLKFFTSEYKINFDFSRVKTIDENSFFYIKKMLKFLELLGVEAYISSIPPHIAAVLSKYDIDDLKIQRRNDEYN